MLRRLSKGQHLQGGQRPLPPTHRQAIVESLLAARFTTGEFELAEDVISTVGTAHSVFAAIHNRTHCYFTFDGRDHAAGQRGGFGGASVAPATSGMAVGPSRQQQMPYCSISYWNAQLEAFSQWLIRLRREADAPDLWNVAQGEKGVFSEAAVADDSNLTPEEVVQVRSAVEEIKAYLFTTIEVTEEQRAARDDQIIRRLDYLIAAGERMTKRDFFNMAVGVLFQMAVEYAANNAGSIFSFALRRISHAIGILRELPHEVIKLLSS
jgi:hypothetical protein